MDILYKDKTQSFQYTVVSSLSQTRMQLYSLKKQLIV